MKRIPKTPVEFDYDLWTTEDGKCMVRVKITGEVTEVDREVMKILRLEEKQMRRGFTSSDPDDAKPQTILSLDVVNEEDVEGPAWLIDPHDYIQESATKRWIIAFRKTLTANQREVFDEVILGGMSVRKFAKLKGCNHKSVLETKNAVCKKIKNNLGSFLLEIKISRLIHSPGCGKQALHFVRKGFVLRFGQVGVQGQQGFGFLLGNGQGAGILHKVRHMQGGQATCS